MENPAAVALNDLLITKNFKPEAKDARGLDVEDPAQAKLFSFDWTTENKNYGTVVVLLSDKDGSLTMYFGDNLGRTMESDDKKQWYAFLDQMKNFAVRNKFKHFSMDNISRLKYTMQGMAAIKEGLFEGYYGKKNISYSDQPKQVRLMIKHSRDIREGEARYRAIESLFVETADGERFRVPSRSLMHGRMLARHCAEGGTPHDTFGNYINEMVSEMATLARFVRAAKHKTFAGEAAELVETAVRHYSDLKAKAKHMISQRGYHEARESFDPAVINNSSEVAESIRNMFVEQTLDSRIEEALPILAKLKEPAMREADEFESWANKVMEGTWALADTPETQRELKDLMSKPLVVGADATNATEQLYDLIGDDILFDRLGDLADRDPNANCWEDPGVINRLGELGIDINPTTGPDSDDEQGVAEGYGDSSIASALTGHIMRQRLDLLKKYGPVKVTQAIDDAAEFFGDVEEIGSSDMYAYVQYVEKALGNMNEQGLAEGTSRGIMLNGKEVDMRSLEIENVDPRDYPDFSDAYIGRASFTDGTDLSDQEMDQLNDEHGDLVHELAYDSLHESDLGEDLDTDGVMMTRPSNMSSESVEQDSLARMLTLAKGY